MHSRRHFLSCISILSAGAVFGGATDLYAGTQAEGPDLKKLWTRFYTVFGGKTFAHPVKTNPDVLPVAGHCYKSGAAVSFSGAGIVAQPVWVYWGQRQRSPADLIVVLYTADNLSKQLRQLNRFEVEALLQLEGNEEQHLRQISLPTDAGTASSYLRVRPKISGDSAVRVTVAQAQSQMAFQTKNFVYC